MHRNVQISLLRNFLVNKFLYYGEIMEKLMQTYHKKLENYFWDYLVPSSGQAETAQGEIIRIAGLLNEMSASL